MNDSSAIVERPWGPAALTDRRARSEQTFDSTAGRRQRWIDSNIYFYQQAMRLLRFIIPEGENVLMLRSDTGDMLAGLKARTAVGVEISSKIIDVAREKHPEARYIHAFPDDESLPEIAEGPFDFVVITNLNDTVDVLQALRNARHNCTARGRVVIYTYNPLWAPLVRLAEKAGMKVVTNEPNWLDEGDMKNLLKLAGFEWHKTYRTVLCPFNIPVVNWFMNRVLAKLPVINRLCFIEVLVGRPVPVHVPKESVGVSVIIPCRNEKGNVADAVRRVPEMGSGTEIIFCDDKSDDGTADEVRRMIRENPSRNIRLVDGPGICKAENVWTGFRAATKEVLMILDADLTTIPEELPFFFDAITSGAGDFINGSRLVYPMPKEAMKATNMLGNQCFSFVFSYILNQRVKDTLCGTKILWREDWKRLEPMLGSWGITDRWGDYELLFGAAKLNRKIIDLPVHYQERTYGTTKMTKVFQNGLRMLHMCFHGNRNLKLKY